MESIREHQLSSKIDQLRKQSTNQDTLYMHMLEENETQNMQLLFSLGAIDGLFVLSRNLGATGSKDTKTSQCHPETYLATEVSLKTPNLIETSSEKI